MIAVLLAQALTFSVHTGGLLPSSPLPPPEAFAQYAPGQSANPFITVRNGAEHQEEELKSEDGFPLPRRSPCWAVAGGYGMAALGASIAAVLQNQFERNASQSNAIDQRGAAVAMTIGAVIGVIPGAIMGNESRRASATIGRGVTTMLVLAGTVAVSFAAANAFGHGLL